MNYATNSENDDMFTKTNQEDKIVGQATNRNVRIVQRLIVPAHEFVDEFDTLVEHYLPMKEKAVNEGYSNKFITFQDYLQLYLQINGKDYLEEFEGDMDD